VELPKLPKYQRVELILDVGIGSHMVVDSEVQKHKTMEKEESGVGRFTKE
jgi:hypothetical protein